MNAARVATAALAAVSLVGLAVAARLLVVEPSLDVAAAESTLTDPLPGGARVAPASPDSLARSIAARDPFRLTRTAAGARFDPHAEAVGVPVQPPAPRPQLTLVGIVLGDEPAALIDGIPGADGTRVLREGERAGDVLLLRIEADRVLVARADTTWTLVVRSRYP